MYTQFFGNYLLNKNVINTEQLLKGMKDQSDTRIKLGTLAIYEGMMTSIEVEKIHILQTHEDKRFGEIAVDEGYLTLAQVEKLCNNQKPDYLLFGQSLIDNGFITTEQFEDYLVAYQSEYKIDNLDFDESQRENVEHIVKSFYSFNDIEGAEQYIDYLVLGFNNLIRFIGTDFTPLHAEVVPEYATNCCSAQKIKGEFNLFTAIDMDVSTAVSFASRYMGKQIDSFDEYVEASLDDFVNLHNGLFSVNMSNDYMQELSLDPPEHYNNTIIPSDKTMYYIPVIFPFGTMSIILGL